MQLDESHVLHRTRDRADVAGMIRVDQNDADGHGLGCYSTRPGLVIRRMARTRSLTAPPLSPRLARMQPLLNIAIQAARRAGEIIVRGLNRLHRLEVHAKGQNDFVTEIDTQAERDIIETVRPRYPQHSFLAEESGQSGDDNEF